MRFRALILVCEVAQCGCVHIPRTDLVAQTGQAEATAVIGRGRPTATCRRVTLDPLQSGLTYEVRFFPLAIVFK